MQNIFTLAIYNFINVIVGGFLFMLLMFIAFKAANKFTPFDLKKELDDGNIAIAIVIAAIFIS